MRLLELTLVVLAAVLFVTGFIGVMEIAARRTFPVVEPLAAAPAIPTTYVPTETEAREEALFDDLGSRFPDELLVVDPALSFGYIRDHGAPPPPPVAPVATLRWLERLEEHLKVSGISLSPHDAIAVVDVDRHSLRLKTGDLLFGTLRLARIERDRVELEHPRYGPFWVYRVRPASIVRAQQLTELPPDWMR